MAQLFSPRADSLLRFTVISALIAVFGAFALAEGFAHSDYATGHRMVRPQPVPFSHQHHAGELGIDCRFCHVTVERTATAGMPATHICMTCHSQIWTGAPMLAPVRDSLAFDFRLEWNRVFELPEYVYFDHAVHVRNGIGCSTCHGDVDHMQMTREDKNFYMTFCLSCHSAPQNNLRPPSEIWNMHWQPPADQAIEGKKLMKFYHINTTGILTNCSTCHR